MAERKELTAKQKEIQEIVRPIFKKYNINWYGLFGAYGMGMEDENTFIDLYCERGDVVNFNAFMGIEKELEAALKHKVNLQFNDADLNPYFLQDVIATFAQLSD